MVAAVIAVVFVIALAIGILYAFFASRSEMMPGFGKEESEAANARSHSRFPTPQVVAFHVHGDTATTAFDVPLGESEAGQHLIDLLSLAAVEHLHAKEREGLPLGGVRKIDVQAKRGDQHESITVVELPEPGKLPSTEDMRGVLEPATDPLSDLAAVVADTTVTAQPSTSGQLESVAEFVRLSGPTNAGLRMVGVDPESMSLEDLTTGLFTAGGYTVQETGAEIVASEPTATVYRFTKPGQDATAIVLPHTPGDHPEVSDRVFTEIAIAAGQGNTGQILLITDKFGPYSMYEREKRTKNVVFVTRERLQAFVDSFGLG